MILNIYFFSPRKATFGVLSSQQQGISLGWNFAGGGLEEVCFWHTSSQLNSKRQDLIVAFFVIRLILHPPLQYELEMVS